MIVKNSQVNQNGKFNSIAVVSEARLQSGASRVDLVDGRAALVEHAVDDLRARFGDAVLIRGLGFDPAEK